MQLETLEQEQHERLEVSRQPWWWHVPLSPVPLSWGGVSACAPEPSLQAGPLPWMAVGMGTFPQCTWLWHPGVPFPLHHLRGVLGWLCFPHSLEHTPRRGRSTWCSTHMG